MIESRPESIIDAIQFGMFRLLASIQLLLLPSDTTDLTRCPPRVVAITDILMKVLKTVERSSRSTIGIKCFLRDYIGSTGNSFLSSQIALAIKEDSRLSEFILNAIDSFVSEKTVIVSFSQETNSFGDFSRKKLPHFNDARYVPVFPDSELLHFLLIIASNAEQPSQSNTVLKSICWCSKSAIQPPVSTTDAFEMEDDDDWLDEDEDEFDDENSFVSTLNLREQELRNNLALYFATLDFDSIDSELIVEVVKLITSLNDSSLYLKVSTNTGFLKALWTKIETMESPLGGKVAERLIGFRPVTEDDFNDFSSLVHYFCSTIRLQLIALSDDELSNDKFLIPAKSLTPFTSFFCRLGVGIVKFLFGGQRDTRISTQSGFNLLTPMSKLLRNLLSRAERNPNIIHRVFSDHVYFPVEDFSILRKQPMLDESSQIQNVAKNFYGARNYDKQLMTILSFFPFAIPFSKRITIFYNLLENDQAPNPSMFRNDTRRMRYRIRRDRVFEDAYSQMSHADWKHDFDIEIMNDGRVEPGFGQGVTRWFTEALLQAAFDPKVGLMLQNENGELYPNPFVSQIYPDSFEAYYKFLGKILGYMVYTKSINYLPLCSFFLSKILRGSIELDLSELQGLDKELYKNLMYLKSNPEEIESMGLDFTANLSALGNAETVELKPNGSNIPVDKYNYTEFIIKVADFHLNKAVARQCNAFRAGFYSIIDQAWVKLFDQREFDILIQGVKQDIDIEDLKKNTVYYKMRDDDDRCFTADHPTIVAFWQVLSDFNTEERVKFLKFTTSSPRAPLRGFAELNPRFTLINTNEDTSRLPSASTCVNLLKMPPYQNRQLLEEKLRLAIEAVTFEFS